MYRLNDKIRELKPYEPITGTYKIRLDANESYLSLPEYVSQEIAAKLVSVRTNRYPDPTAADLCAAFAKYYGVDAAFVAAGNGSDELISLLFTGFLMKGEVYATLDADFSMYDFYGALSEGRGVKIPKNPDLTVDVQQVIESCQKEQARLLIFSNPCNPTSLGLCAPDVRAIVKALPQCLVVVDEAYMDFWDQSLLGDISHMDNLLILRTCSKAFGLAAARVGFAVGHPNVICAIKAIKSPYNVNTLSQVMAQAVLKHKGEARAAVNQILLSTKQLSTLLQPILADGSAQLLPSTTNFVVLKTPKSKELYEYLLELGIAVRCFPGFLRITAGNNHENCQLVKFIGRFFGKQIDCTE